MGPATPANVLTLKASLEDLCEAYNDQVRESTDALALLKPNRPEDGLVPAVKQKLQVIAGSEAYITDLEGLLRKCRRDLKVWADLYPALAAIRDDPGTNELITLIDQTIGPEV